MKSTASHNYRILCVPGFGHAMAEQNWFEKWEGGIRRFLSEDGYRQSIELVPFRISQRFSESLVESDRYAEALAALAFGLPQSTFGQLFRQTYGVDPLAEALKWRAATIVQWGTQTDLRTSLTEAFQNCLFEFQPDVILAFSLGSLVAYDGLRSLEPAFLENRCLITFGSQLGNPYVRNLYAGRITGLGLKAWFNLFNDKDRVFTSPLNLQDENYRQICMSFDNPDPLDHTAISTGAGIIGYLDHFATRQLVWPSILNTGKVSPFVGSVRRALKTGRAFNSPDHRALLIGIDHYRDDSVPDLAGCVNDTYLFSEILQSVQFPVDNIRLLHNHRATKEAIMDRISWLLDDVKEGEFRLLHFSGHGAQLDSYGVGETIDRLDECVCPHDFDWSVGNAILDDVLCALYSQLPYGAHFVLVLDCCHSGGMARSGQSVRGLSPPRDVAHRGLFYEPEEQNLGVWRKRGNVSPNRLPEPVLEPETDGHPYLINPDFFGDLEATDTDQKTSWIGRQGTIRKIGRSPSLRRLSSGEFDARRRELKHDGPYLPTIFEACSEDEPALEHMHGSSAHGAFSFCLVQILRERLKLGAELDYQRVLNETRDIMEDLGYVQTPRLLCPRGKHRVQIPDIE